jgi:hypothetical protein
MLRKIASMVKPIMRQRSWYVNTLAEFYPQEHNLLGMNTNQGQIIQLRLRHAGDETQFLPFEQILDTMLHELTHNVHGPHNQHFHALWAKLREEQEALLRKGYTGEGFLSKGNRLGGRHVPMSEMRRLARASAETRRNLTANSGSRLGGTGILRSQDPREVIAAAAERRNRIDRGCASGTEQGRQIAAQANDAAKDGNLTTTQAEQEDENEAAWTQAMIELIQEDEAKLFGKNYVPPSQSNPAGLIASSSTPSSGLDAASLRKQQLEIERSLKLNKAPVDKGPSTSKPPPPPSSSPSPPAAETWVCEVCTLINPVNHLLCGACETERPHSPSPPSSTPSALKPRLGAMASLARIESQAANKPERAMGWTCHCGNWMEQQWWTCAACGRMKTSS